MFTYTLKWDNEVNILLLLVYFTQQVLRSIDVVCITVVYFYCLHYVNIPHILIHFMDKRTQYC